MAARRRPGPRRLPPARQRGLSSAGGRCARGGVARAAVLHVTGITPGLGPGPAGALTRAIAVAREAGVTVSFDVNYRRALWSEADAAAAIGAVLGECDVVFAGLDEARIDNTRFEVPAPAAAVVDTVGAGDAFVAGYLAELVAGEPPATRLATAVRAGALAVTAPGDWEGMPDREALERHTADEPVIR